MHSLCTLLFKVAQSSPLLICGMRRCISAAAASAMSAWPASCCASAVTYRCHAALTDAGAFVGAIQRGKVIVIVVVVPKLLQWHSPPPGLKFACHWMRHSVDASCCDLSFHGRVCRKDCWMWRIDAPVMA